MVDKLKVEMIKLEKIKQYKNNAKLHPEWQVQQIANSIEKFGFNDPIAIDKDNTIIEGHGRYLASKLLDLETVPVIKLDHLSDSERRAYIIAHNKLTTSTGFDEEMLEKEIEDIVKMPELSEADLEKIGIDIDAKEKTPEKKESFEDKAEIFDNSNCKYPIVPKFFEKHECFVIPIHNEIDENFIRDIFGLNENHISESGDKKLRKTNVISVESVRCLVK